MLPPCPSWLASFFPHAKTRPSAVRASECCGPAATWAGGRRRTRGRHDALSSSSSAVAAAAAAGAGRGGGAHLDTHRLAQEVDRLGHGLLAPAVAAAAVLALPPRQDPPRRRQSEHVPVADSDLRWAGGGEGRVRPTAAGCPQRNTYLKHLCTRCLERLDQGGPRLGRPVAVPQPAAACTPREGPPAVDE